MKLKHAFATLTFTVAATLSAGAAVNTVKAFPQRLMPTEKAQAQTNPVMRAPLNQERNKGLKVFGATLLDWDRVRHFSNWYDNEYMLEKLSWISKEDEQGIDRIRDLHMIHAGAYNPDDGNYYAYKVSYYTIGITYALQWLKVNPENGEWQIVSNLPNDMHNGDPLYDMAYSVYDSEMYGLVQNVDGQVKSRIGLMDLTDSSMSDYVQLDEYYFAIAFDYDGTLYGIRWDYDKNDPEGRVTGTRLDEFDSNFKVKKSNPIRVDGQAFIPSYQHGLEFDYSTGDLIWGAVDTEGSQRMVRINPDTYETENLGKVGVYEVMIGLHVPFTTATDREAPARVADLKTVANTDGANTVSLSWTNPTTTWNRKALSNLTSVYVYRDNLQSEPVAKLDAVGMEGKAMTYTDATAKGVHTYYIRAVNAKGLGVDDSIEGYAGHDVPGKVTNLQVQTIDNGLGVKISWDLPETGDSDGWYDKTTMKYTLTRMPGNTVVAKDITTTAYEDKNIEEAQFYSYIVTPSSADGEGTPCTSDGILAGASLKVPFATSFNTADEANRFTSLNSFGLSGAFQYEYNLVYKDGRNTPRYGYESSNNAMFATPSLNLAKGKKYRVKWSYMLCQTMFNNNIKHNHFRFVGGEGLSYDKLTNVIADFTDAADNAYTKITRSAYFESPVDGDYNIAFQILTDNDNDAGWIYITDFSIVECPDNDLEVEKLDAAKYISKDNENYFDVTVLNNGANTQSAYKVEVGVQALNGTFTPFASTTDVPTLAPYESKVVRVKGNAGYNGIHDLQAHVVLEGDGNTINDFSELQEVEFMNGAAFNNTAVVKETVWADSSRPFQLYSTYSASQAIYPYGIFDFDKSKNEVYIGALAWEYKSEKDVDDTRIKVYLGTTDKEYYKSGKQKGIGGQTLVYEGIVPISEGSHWLMVNFSDNTFTLPAGKNLIVTVECEESAANGSFPVLFNVYNSPSADSDLVDNNVHSLRFDSNSPFSYDSKDMWADTDLPILHVATGSQATGIEAAPCDALKVRVQGRTAFVSGNVASLCLYDMNGRKLLNASVSNGQSVQLPVASGAYILRAADAQGNASVTKVIIR